MFKYVDYFFEVRESGATHYSTGVEYNSTVRQKYDAPRSTLFRFILSLSFFGRLSLETHHALL